MCWWKADMLWLLWMSCSCTCCWNIFCEMHVDSFFGLRFCLGRILTVTNNIYEAFCPFFFSCNLSLAISLTSIKLWNKKNKVIEVCAAMFYAHLNLWSMFPGTVDNTFKRQRLVNAYFFCMFVKGKGVLLHSRAIIWFFG